MNVDNKRPYRVIAVNTKTNTQSILHSTPSENMAYRIIQAILHNKKYIFGKNNMYSALGLYHGGECILEVIA